MPVYPLVRVRYYSANPRYKDGAIAEDGVFLRYDDAGQIIKSVGWDMALSPPQRVVETLADDQLDQLGVAPHEADRLAFRRHRFSESIARPAVRFDELGVDAAEAARLIVEDRELRACEPRVTVTRTILLVYQDGRLLNPHHLPADVDIPYVLEAVFEPPPPNPAQRAFANAWDVQDENAAAIVG